jgi:uncharacterized membrane protein YebE (DUF533 family)
VQSGAGGSGGSLSDILGGLLGGAQAGGTGGATSGTGGGGAASPSGTSAAGTGNLAKYGGIAVISILALQALKKWQAQQAGGSAASSPAMPSPGGFDPRGAPGGADALSGLLVKAMIAATQADGVVDEDEQRRLVGRLDQLGVGADARNAFAKQLSTRVDPNELVAAVISPEMALQVYAASTLAISVDTKQERAYLDGLARALSIDEGLKIQIENTLGRG